MVDELPLVPPFDVEPPPLPDPDPAVPVALPLPLPLPAVGLVPVVAVPVGALPPLGGWGSSVTPRYEQVETCISRTAASRTDLAPVQHQFNEARRSS